jgi:type 1 glutamine amidotransferase
MKKLIWSLMVSMLFLKSSTPVIGWAKQYGKARVVTLQSGHDVPTFENPNFRKLLKQAILWVFTDGRE